MIKNNILNKPSFAIGCLFLLGGIISWLVYAQLDQSKHTRERLVHSYEVINQIQLLSPKLLNDESGILGFSNTESRSYLLDAFSDYTEDHLDTPYDDIPKKGPTIKELLIKLRLLTTDNLNQQKRLDNLQAFVDRKTKLIEDAYNISIINSPQETKQSAHKARLFLDQHNNGYNLNLRLSAILNAMLAEENTLLQTRIQDDETSGRNNMVTVVGLVLLLFTLVPIAFLTIQKELNRRKRAEKTLSKQASFQRAVLDSSMYSIVATDAKGVIRMFNRAAERMLQYRAEEMVDKQNAIIYHDLQETIGRAAQLSQELGEHIDPGFDVLSRKTQMTGTEEREWTFVRKDQSQLPVLLSVTAMYNDYGTITGYLSVAKDITESKQIEKMKHEFISMVSHELRTPLTSIRGSLGLVAGNVAGALPDKAKQLIDIAYKNSERLVRLINDILDIEKIEAGSMKFDMRPLSLDAILRQAVEENQGFADKYGVHLVLSEKSQGGRIKADSDRLIQVITNLVSNGIKFSPSGSEVTLNAVRIGDRIKVTIRDRGPGIPDEFKPRIFGKFAQADSSTTREKGGTGLGLSISKSIVEAMGGTIGFDSELGKGTTFYFFLPALAENAGSKDKVAPQIYNPLSHDKILICEDDEDIAMLLQMILEKEGFTCEIAHDADEVKQMLENQVFAAMTLDLVLPGQDGIALIHDLRKNDETAALPIVVVSAHAEDGRKKLNGDAIGIVDWLSKPISPERLVRALKIACSKSRPSILHVEDDPDIVNLIAMSLEGVADVAYAHTLADARRQLEQTVFDLIILDIRLPDGNGLDLLPLLDDRPDPIPIVILSVTETSREVQEKVVASMVKSIVSEDKIIHTIKSLIDRKAIT